ncbi:MAG TPA: CoF synthetase [Candidatus Krumholzibacteria bacterium]|nr:CoF synthetase [Candidatus Krumholzibacteria bacterium]
MNEIKDSLLGNALQGADTAALSSFGAYSLLFAPGLVSGLRLRASRARAQAAFWNAHRRVPAYRDFLREHAAERPRRFEDVPPMDKDGYIRRHPLESRCQFGRFPSRDAVIDESSGSSGKATSWVRGPAEREATRRLLQFGVRHTFGKEPFILLNAFALGPWATGMNVSMSLVEQCVLKSVGPDQAKLEAALQDLGPGYRYLITGYPPFLKQFVDHADIDWKKYRIHAAVGGEGMSEGLRAALNRRFQRTISSFGASDLEINMAVETDFTIALRQELARNADLARDLYGSEGLPMVFQYDPLSYYIESDGERNLLFTLNRLDNVSPRIRYNLYDRGIAMRCRNALEMLRDHRVALDPPAPRVNLPLLFHWGRREHAVAFYGCKITPDDVQNAITRVPLLQELTANYALHPYEDDAANKRLEIWIELSAESQAPDDVAGITEGLKRELAAVNQDFREAIRMIQPGFHPILRFFPHGEGPLAGQDPRVKRRYIL